MTSQVVQRGVAPHGTVSCMLQSVEVFPANKGLSWKEKNERKKRESLLPLSFLSSWETFANIGFNGFNLKLMKNRQEID